MLISTNFMQNRFPNLYICICTFVIDISQAFLYRLKPGNCSKCKKGCEKVTMRFKHWLTLTSICSFRRYWHDLNEEQSCGWMTRSHPINLFFADQGLLAWGVILKEKNVLLKMPPMTLGSNGRRWLIWEWDEARHLACNKKGLLNSILQFQQHSNQHSSGAKIFHDKIIFNFWASTCSMPLKNAWLRFDLQPACP